jgi:hypothetical protein
MILVVLLGLAALVPARAEIPVVSVTASGAVGDGHTDDTAAIGKALAQLSGATDEDLTGVLYFPPGSYAVSAPLSFRSGTRVFGPAATVVNVSGYRGPLVKFTGSVHDLYFHLNVASAEGEALVQEDGALRDSYFENCRFSAGTGSAFRAVNVRDCTFLAVDFAGGAGGSAWRVSGKLSHASLLGCRLLAPGPAPVVYLDLPDSGQSVFLSCLLQTGGGAAVRVVAGRDLVFRSVYVINQAAASTTPLWDLQKARSCALQVVNAPAGAGTTPAVAVNGYRSIVEHLADWGSPAPQGRPALWSDDPRLAAENIAQTAAAGGGFQYVAQPTSALFAFLNLPGAQTKLNAWLQGQQVQYPLDATVAGDLTMAHAYDFWLTSPPPLGVPLEKVVALGGFADLRKFGAKPGEDCSAALQAAIQSAANTGGAVYIPEGTWTLAHPVTWSGNLSLWGEGPDRSLLSGSADFAGTLLAPVPGAAQAPPAELSLHGLALNGGDYAVSIPDAVPWGRTVAVQAQFTDQRQCGWQQSSAGLGSVFSDCHWEGAPQGLALTETGPAAAEQALFLRCDFSGLQKLGAAAGGAQVQQAPAHLTWRECSFRNCGGTGLQLGGGAAPAREIVVDDCAFENCATTDAAPYLDALLSNSLIVETHAQRTGGVPPPALFAVAGTNNSVQWCRLTDESETKAPGLLVGGTATLLRAIWSNDALLMLPGSGELLAQGCQWFGNTGRDVSMPLSSFSGGAWQSLTVPTPVPPAPPEPAPDAETGTG